MSFVLKEPKSADETAILLLHTCADGRLKYYTGEKIIPALWRRDQLSRGTRAALDRIRAVVEDTVESCKLNGTPLTKSLLQARLNEGKASLVGSGDYFTYLYEIINEMESGAVLTRWHKKFSPGTIKGLRFTVSLLQRFNPQMTAASVTLDTYHRFIGWCHDRGYATNYIGGQIKNWKRLSRGLSPIFDSDDFKQIWEPAVDVALSQEEIKAIASVNLRNLKDQYARDWFVIGCYTGLRISDLKQLNKKNIGAGFITIANEKTDERVQIPTHPLVENIVKRYKGFPGYIHEAEINEKIKKIAKLAGITTKCLHTITKGGRRVDTYLKKCDMISLHTARRSLITNLRKSGVPDSIVMKLTGIRSIATLQKYDKLTVDEAARIAASHEFFKG